MTQPGTATQPEQRRAALGQDVLLFCAAFTLGVLAFVASYVILDVTSPAAQR